MLEAKMFTIDSRASDSRATEFEIRKEINFTLKTRKLPRKATTATVVFFNLLKHQ